MLTSAIRLFLALPEIYRRETALVRERKAMEKAAREQMALLAAMRDEDTSQMRPRLHLQTASGANSITHLPREHAMHWADWALIILFGGMGAVFLITGARAMWLARKLRRLRQVPTAPRTGTGWRYEGESAGHYITEAHDNIVIGHHSFAQMTEASNVTCIRELDTPSSKRK